ncbi:hypothetical protein RhiirC2_267369 [Rhizophagus irregularis]|uniref:Uncharacterized protein n=1 Tax=Rhizophagus irregularis TaxID=588596 RepID=A0A2N1MEH5_9GLOM|nr:hypothetical protein RhiirC2_267369 [Rhizophagus irregularis]
MDICKKYSKIMTVTFDCTVFLKLYILQFSVFEMYINLVMWNFMAYCNKFRLKFISKPFAIYIKLVYALPFVLSFSLVLCLPYPSSFLSLNLPSINFLIIKETFKKRFDFFFFFITNFYPFLMCQRPKFFFLKKHFPLTGNS